MNKIEITDCRMCKKSYGPSSKDYGLVCTYEIPCRRIDTSREDLITPIPDWCPILEKQQSVYTEQ